MGNIKSFCCRDSASESDDREERARILNDNNGSTNSLYNNSSNRSQDDLSYGSMNNGEGGGRGGAGGGAGGSGSKTMEQSALDKIYQKLAANVIDVAPGESMVIQTAEFIERQKAYQARLNQIKAALPLRSSTSKVPRNLNGSMLDTSSASNTTANTSATTANNNNNSNNTTTNNNTRINTSISTAGANLTAFNQLNATLGTTSSNSSSNHNATHNGGLMHLTNNTTSTTSSGVGTSGGGGGSSSNQHLGPAKDRPRVEYEPISMEEVQLINEISDRTVKAIKNLRVVSNEPVVTCFKP